MFVASNIFSKDMITKCDISSVYKILPQLARVYG